MKKMESRSILQCRSDVINQFHKRPVVFFMNVDFVEKVKKIVSFGDIISQLIGLLNRDKIVDFLAIWTTWVGVETRFIVQESKTTFLNQLSLFVSFLHENISLAVTGASALGVVRST